MKAKLLTRGIYLSIVLMVTMAVSGCAVPTVKTSPGQSSRLEADPFLRPYVAQLKRETPATALDRISAMSSEDLIELHFGYGTWIRNKWLWSGGEPALVNFFMTRGIEHPDDMSMVLIRALWENLNEGLAPAERTRIEAKRALVAMKKKAYRQLSEECAAQLAPSKDAFERCYVLHGLPSKNPLGRKPFYELIVANTGIVKEIVFYEGASEMVKRCLGAIIEKYRFSGFEHDEKLTLYIVKFPHCNVSEQFRLNR